MDHLGQVIVTASDSNNHLLHNVQFLEGGILCDCEFLQREAMLVRYMLSSCVCLSGTVSKRLNIGSCKQCRTNSPGTLVFWCCISRQHSNNHPLWGHQTEVRQVQIGHFRPTREHSYYRTLIGTHMHSVEWRYFQWLWVTPNHPIFVSSLWVTIETTNLVDTLIVAKASPWMTNCPCH